LVKGKNTQAPLVWDCKLKAGQGRMWHEPQKMAELKNWEEVPPGRWVEHEALADA
jgi:hypothetical protein